MLCFFLTSRVQLLGVSMPQCCWCNGSGRCKGCVCAKNKRLCTSCTPGRNGWCENQSALSSPSYSPPDVQTAIPGTRNDETLESIPGTRNVETQAHESRTSSMADVSPDDQYQAFSEQEDNGLPAIIPMQSPDFHWKEIVGEEFVRGGSTLEEKPIQSSVVQGWKIICS